MTQRTRTAFRLLYLHPTSLSATLTENGRRFWQWLHASRQQPTSRSLLSHLPTIKLPQWPMVSEGTIPQVKQHSSRTQNYPTSWSRVSIVPLPHGRPTNRRASTSIFRHPQSIGGLPPTQETDPSFTLAQSATSMSTVAPTTSRYFWTRGNQAARSNHPCNQPTLGEQ